MNQTVAEYPAFVVVARQPKATMIFTANRGRVEEAVVLSAGEIVVLPNHLTRYEIGSVASSAIQDNSCPMEAIARAKEFGHKLVYFVQQAACLSNHKTRPEDRPRVIQVEIGMKIMFQGHFYEIQSAPNDNLKLVEV